MAGQSRTGARVASSVAVSRSDEIPAVYVPIRRAVAGTTRIRSALCPSRVWGMGSGLSHRRVRVRSEARAEKVSSPTKRVAARVSTGLTRAPASTEAPADLDRLVGGDAAADAEDDVPAGEGRRRHGYESTSSAGASASSSTGR